MEITNGIISLKQINAQDYPGFAEIKLLYYRAFQPDERREAADLVAQMENKAFTLLMIMLYDKPVGLVAIWQFSSFIFVEHMAVTEQFRNRKIGETVIKMIVDNQEQPVVLETAHATDNISSSRLAFYQRAGFDIIDENYEQPAYNSEKNAVKMLLLSNRLIMPDPVEDIIQEIHRVVYKK
jgi:ribosomal protein S18 acetylase RimI-like enzyme